MKRSMIIGAALLVQSAMAQETNQLDEPFEPARKVEWEWVFFAAGRETNEAKLNFIDHDSWQIERGSNVPTRFQAWNFPKAGDGSTNEKSVNGWDEYVQSGDYEAKMNYIPELFTVDPDAIERENRARLAYLNQHEDEIIKAYKVGAKKFFFIGAVLGFTLGAFSFMKEPPRTSQ